MHEFGRENGIADTEFVAWVRKVAGTSSETSIAVSTTFPSPLVSFFNWLIVARSDRRSTMYAISPSTTSRFYSQESRGRSEYGQEAPRVDDREQSLNRGVVPHNVY